MEFQQALETLHKNLQRPKQGPSKEKVSGRTLVFSFAASCTMSYVPLSLPSYRYSTASEAYRPEEGEVAGIAGTHSVCKQDKARSHG